MIDQQLQGWLPYRLETATSSVEWLFTGSQVFSEPFFDDTIMALHRLPFNQKPFKVVSDLEMMKQWAEAVDNISPSAIIFHVSRCGSTLLTQLLGQDSRNIVLSEVPLFDEILRLPYKKTGMDPEDVKSHLEAAIRLYGQRRISGQERLFIKTDSWHLHYYEAFRKLYPDVPFVVLYRHPAEVLSSQRKQRGVQSVPGLLEPEIFGFGAEVKNAYDLDRYMANVLETYFAKMVEIVDRDPLCFPFDYGKGIPLLLHQLYQRLGLALTPQLHQDIASRSQFHAKHPHQVFKEGDHGPIEASLWRNCLDYYQQLQLMNRF